MILDLDVSRSVWIHFFDIPYRIRSLYIYCPSNMIISKWNRNRNHKILYLIMFSIFVFSITATIFISDRKNINTWYSILLKNQYFDWRTQCLYRKDREFKNHDHRGKWSLRIFFWSLKYSVRLFQIFELYYVCMEIWRKSENSKKNYILTWKINWHKMNASNSKSLTRHST